MFRNPSCRRRDPDRRVSLLLLATAAPFLMAAAPMNGSAWRSELAQLGTPVSDAELGEMRGKFITPDSVSFFGANAELTGLLGTLLQRDEMGYNAVLIDKTDGLRQII